MSIYYLSVIASIIIGCSVYKWIINNKNQDVPLNVREIEQLMYDYKQFQDIWEYLIYDEVNIPETLYISSNTYKPIINCLFEWHQKINSDLDINDYKLIKNCLDKYDEREEIRIRSYDILLQIEFDLCDIMSEYTILKEKRDKYRMYWFLYASRSQIILPPEIIMMIAKKIE